MSDRRKAGAKNRTMAYIAAGVVHVALLGVLLFNFTNDDERELVSAFDAEKLDTVKASLIDESQITDQLDKLKKAERDKLRDKQREQDELKRIKEQTEREKKKVADLKAEQKREEQRAEEFERELKAIALKREKEQEKLKKEAALAKKAAAAKKKREQDEQDRLERERLQKRLAEEEAQLKRQEAERRAKERTTTVVGKFFSGIQRKIEQTRTVDPSFETWRKSVVDIKLSPSGEVMSVRTIESSGLPQYDQSVETAIYASGPFDMPDETQDPDAVKQLQSFELTVKHPSARR